MGAGAAIFAGAKSAANAADDQIKLARSLGLTIGEYGKLQFAVEQAGASTGQFQTGFTRFNRRITDAASRGGRTADVFERLGVSLADAEGNLPARMGCATWARRPRRWGAPPRAAGAPARGHERRAQPVEAGGRGGRNQIFLLFAPAITRGADALIERLRCNRDVVEDYCARSSTGGARRRGSVRAAARARSRGAQPADPGGARRGVEFGREVQAAIERIVVLASEAVIEIGRRVADALNAVFGTDFTGRQVLIGAAILKLSGVFGVLAASIKVARAAWLLFAAAPIGRILTLTTAAVAGVAFW